MSAGMRVGRDRADERALGIRCPPAPTRTIQCGGMASPVGTGPRPARETTASQYSPFAAQNVTTSSSRFCSGETSTPTLTEGELERAADASRLSASARCSGSVADAGTREKSSSTAGTFFDRARADASASIAASERSAGRTTATQRCAGPAPSRRPRGPRADLPRGSRRTGRPRSRSARRPRRPRVAHKKKAPASEAGARKPTRGHRDRSMPDARGITGGPSPCPSRRRPKRPRPAASCPRDPAAGGRGGGAASISISLASSGFSFRNASRSRGPGRCAGRRRRATSRTSRRASPRCPCRGARPRARCPRRS